MDTKAALAGAEREEAWAGEVRVNLVRLVALTAFYGHHLLNYFVFSRGEMPAEFHALVTAVAIAWAAGAAVLHAVLSRRWNPPFLKYAVGAGDAALATALLLLADGPRSPLVVILFLLIFTAPLRLDVRFVWAATLLSLLAYAVVCGHARWVEPELRVPRSQQAIFAIGLVCAGLLAGQAVRQARRLARGLSGGAVEAEPRP
jgi:hypothetical protein